MLVIRFLTAILFTVGASIGASAQLLGPEAQNQKLAILLDEPELSFNLRIDLINSAQKDDSIELVYFIIRDDFYGLTLIDSLLRAAKRGVRVRFIVDDLNNKVHHALWSMTELYPHFQVKFFRPFPNLNPRTIGRRVHDKFLILNKSEIIFGGRNIGREYFSPYTTWTDTDVYLSGPVASDASDYFDLIWSHKIAKDLKQRRYGLKTKKLVEAFQLCSTSQSPSGCLEHNKEAIYTLFYEKCRPKHSGVSKTTDCKEQYQRFFKYHHHWWKSREDISETQGYFKNLFDIRQKEYVEMAVAYEDAVWLNNYNNVHDWSRGIPQGSLSDVLYTAIADANQRVWMAVPYMITTKAMRSAFEISNERTNSQLEVFIATNSITSSDSTLTTLASKARQKKLERNNVKILRKGDQRFLHSKMALIDSDIIFISSHNMDPRSEKLNSESGAVIKSAELSKLVENQMIDIFNTSWYDDPKRINRKKHNKKHVDIWDSAFHIFADKILLNIPGAEDQL